MVRRAPLLLLVPAVAVAGGCGGDGKAKEPPRLTQNQFVAQANRVCIAADRRVFRIGSLSRDPAGWDQTTKAARRGVREMARLRPPLDKQKGFDRMLRLARRQVQNLENVRDGLKAGNEKAWRAAVVKATDTDTAIKLQARSLGLTFCEQLLTNWPA